MRVVYGSPMNPYWYREGGSVSWGFGIEVTHFGSPADTEEGDIIPEGWNLTLTFGPWMVDIFSEAGARQVFSEETLTYMGRVSRL